MKTLREAIASRSPESQARIKEMAEEMIIETGLQLMREELQLSQKTLAESMGVSQPAITLQLHSDGAFELEGGGQQAGGNQQLAQQVLHLYRVVLGIDDVAIGTIQLDQLPPHFVLFEQIAIQEILVTHHAFLGFSGRKDKYIVKQVVRN